MENGCIQVYYTVRKHFVCNFSVLAMAYTLVIVKDSRKVREARLAKEATEALLQNDKNNALVCILCSAFILIFDTVDSGDSIPVTSKLQPLVNFLLLTKISNHSINYLINNKHLFIANIFVY